MNDKTKTTPTVDTKAAAAVTATLTKAAHAFMASYVSLAKAVQEAVNGYKAAGLDDKAIAAEVKAVFEKVGTTKNLNACLKKAGIRQRGLRCDAGFNGLMLRFGNIKPGKPSNPSEVAPSDRIKAAVLRLVDGDKAKAIEALKAAIAAIEAE